MLYLGLIMLLLMMFGVILLFVPFQINVYGVAKCLSINSKDFDTDFDLYAIINFAGIIKKKITYKKIKKLIDKPKTKKRRTRVPNTALKLNKLSVHAALGTTDSAVTALSVGAAYAALVIPLGILCQYTDASSATFDINIQPDYEKFGLYAEGCGIFSGKIANIIFNTLIKKGRK